MASVPGPVSSWPSELKVVDEHAAAMVHGAMGVLVQRGELESSVSVPVPASLEELKSFCKGYLRGLRSVPNGHRLARDWCFPMGDVAKGKLDGAELPELTSWVFECVGLTVKYGTQMPPVARTTTERNRARRERQGR